jgi:hypothetical protein
VGKAAAVAIKRGAIAGAVADFAVWDGNEGRLSNLVESFPSVANPITEYLAADESDPELYGRFKNTLEGLGIGAAVEAIALGVRRLKFGRVERAREGSTPESVLAAADKGATAAEIERAGRLATGLGQDARGMDLVRVAQENPDGFTYDPRSGRVLKTGPGGEFGPDEYMVSIEGAEARFKPGDTAAIDVWREKHAAALKPDEYIGGWLDRETGDFFLDISRRYSGEDAARTAGKGAKQKAIFHPFTREVKALEEAAQNVGDGKQAPTVRDPAEIGLRNLGVAADRVKDILRRVRDREALTMEVAPGAGVPDFGTARLNPLKLSAAERLSLELTPESLNLEHYMSPEGPLELVRVIEDLYGEVAKQDIPGLAGKTLDEQQEAALAAVADYTGAQDEQAFMAMVQARQSETMRSANQLGARIHGDRFLVEATLRRHHKLLLKIEKVLAGEEAGVVEELLVRAQESTQFVAATTLAVKGMGAEVGRMLGGFRMNIGGFQLPDFVKKLSTDPHELDRTLNELGGRDRLIQIMKDQLKGFGDGGPQGLLAGSKLVRASAGKRLLNMTLEFWINAILSSPRSTLVNVLGPSAHAVYKPLETLAGAGIQRTISSAKGDTAAAIMQTEVMADLAEQATALSSSVPDAMLAAKRMSMGGESLLDPRSSAVDAASRRRAITAENAGLNPDSIAGAAFNWIGNVVRVPTGLLGKGDELLKQVNYRSFAKAALHREAIQAGKATAQEVAEYVAKKMDQLVWDRQGYSNRQVYRRGAADARAAGLTAPDEVEKFAVEFVKNNWDPKTNALSEKANAYAQEITFTTPAEPGTLSWGLQRLTAQHPYLRFIVPFINTPVNIAKFTAQRLDAVGVARGVYAHAFPEYAASLKETKNRFLRDMLSNDPRKIADATGRIAVGTSLSAFFLAKAYDGSITGRGPSDPEQRRILMDSGWLPYSFKTSNGYLSYARLDPIATLIGTMADVADYGRFAAVDDQGMTETVVNGVLISMANNFTNKSYLAGIANAVEALSEPDKFMPTFVSRFAGSFVPTAAAHAVLAVGNDDNMRDVRSILDAAVSRTPGLSATLPPQRNVLGEPVQRVKALGADTVGRWVDWFNPIMYREVSDDVVRNELADLGHAFTPPKRTSNGRDLSDVRAGNTTAYDRWSELHGTVQLRGMVLKDALRKEIQSDRYQRLSAVSAGGMESPRVARINGIIRAYRAAAYDQLAREQPEIADHDDAFKRTKRQLRRGIDQRIVPQGEQ